MSDPPALSVVVAASDSAGAVARTLASLAHRRTSADVEVLVVAARDRIDPPDSTPEGIRWLAADPGSGVPRLRRLGLDAARSPLVAFTEDSCLVAPGWAGSWREAFRDPRVRAATGPVAPAMGDAPLDWAVFFCEYAPFLPTRREGLNRLSEFREVEPPGEPRHPTRQEPRAPRIKEEHLGPARRLAGNNFALRRDLRDELDRTEVHETEVLRAVAERRGRAIMIEEARVEHVRRYEVREALGDRLRFGFEYGQLRARRLPGPVRVLGLGAGPAILAVQAARLTATVLARRQHLGPFAESLPITLALLTAWSVGEWLGGLSAPVRLPDACKRRGTGGRPSSRPPAPVGS